MPKALCIRQPYAWLIVNGHKDVENRTWTTRYRGPLLIHASLKWFDDREPTPGIFIELDLDVPPMERGGIVGVVDLVDVVTSSRSGWFYGPFGFVLKNPRLLPFRRLRGKQGLFNVD